MAIGWDFLKGASMPSDIFQRLETVWPLAAPALAPELFNDDELYRLELKRVFEGPVWHVVGHAAELPSDKDFKAHRIGEVPVIVLRNGNAFSVLVNACAHRGAQVIRGSRGSLARPGSFNCIYHRWAYSTDGRVQGVGRREGYAEDFQVKDFCLPRARVAVIGGVIFASLDKSPPPIEEYLGRRVIGYLERLYGATPLTYLGVQRAIFQCNWKLYIENIYDSYHAVTLHKGFRMMRLRKPAPQLEDPSIRDHGHYLSEYQADVPESTGLANPDLFETRSRTDGGGGHVIANLFPASQMTEQVDVLALRLVVPRGVEETEIQFHVFGRVDDGEAIQRHRLWQAANFIGPQGLINLEDAAALARLQTSLGGRSRNLDGLGGRRFPDRRADEKALDTFYAAYRRILLSESPETHEVGESR